MYNSNNEYLFWAIMQTLYEDVIVMWHYNIIQWRSAMIYTYLLLRYLNTILGFY